ncbi:4-hydroxybenzoate octaprenyltransferase [Paludibacterium purpuratum]|uniref:4-hydroxybenzoate octaprenyltransferase n=1 Tax=Paludibacterium purpuratum TaxID=1144873 RepID=A0A4R7BBK0_9NEIS|nr:4-hydroxybenzoate octaprenyltransferase [Paludibacterium purpuratum]TDR81452.1 4-hydroxybenzoate polyprenyltransferase [Paludibacterium purpuratum]
MSPALRQRLALYCQLMRIDKPIGTLLLLWPTLWAIWIASNGHPPLAILAIFVLGTFLMRSAGCVINDYADRDFDGQVARTSGRPFARKAVSGREALLLATGLALLSLLLILPLNALTLELSVIAVLVAASYPFTKRFFPLPQAYLGIAFSFGIPMAFAAITGTVPGTAWLLTLATGFWVVAYDTAYAMADKPDDLKIGIKTSAITFGDHDVLAIMLCHAVFLLLLSWLGLQWRFGNTFYVFVLFSVILIIIQYREIKGRDRQRCFKVFLDNNRVGAALFAGIALDYLLR